MTSDAVSLGTLDRPGIEAAQETKLRSLMAALGDNAFYTAKLAAADRRPEEIRRLDDLRSIPFTTKQELLASQREHPPYGRLLTFPLSRYLYLSRTSGTSGRPLLWLDTAEDWQYWRRCWSQVYRGAGVGADDLVFCAFSFGPYIAHWAGIDGARAVGALSLPGGGMSSKQRIEAILGYGCTVLVSTPTYALHLGEIAAGLGIDLAASAVRATIHAGEPGANVPHVQRRIETIWGARCFDHAGATEVGAWGFDCHHRDNDLHLNETELHFEVVDPETGEAVDDGTRGELVITSLGRHGMPVLRYRTGDLVVRRSEPCACGSHAAKLEGGVLGRSDDMVVVRGVNVFPSAVDNLVRSIPQVTEYEVEVRQTGGMDDLVLKVETAPDAAFDTVEEALLEVFTSQLNLRIRIAQAAAGSLPRYELKARRFKRSERR